MLRLRGLVAGSSCRASTAAWRPCPVVRAQQQRLRRALRRVATTAEGPTDTAQGTESPFFQWLESAGAGNQKVKIQAVERAGVELDTTVAATEIAEGDVALHIPEELVVTLTSVFEDSTVAELLTSGKLSELACLTLYMMYEKKLGRASRWYHFIKELDRQRGRGQQGAKSPLLWDEGQVADLLQGSPVIKDITVRLKGIENEYDELDTVWFMAGSLFKNYPYDTPTETFSRELFVQAFAAVQSSVVHLQGVRMSQRFALVPLGPPLLAYSTTAKAMLMYDKGARAVQLTADRPYRAGDPVVAWCGPQPNNRLLLNYGIVDEDNPYDRLTIVATLALSDPLYQAKRAALAQHKLGTQQEFVLQRRQSLPDNLLPYLRLAHCRDASALAQESVPLPLQPLSAGNERAVLHQLLTYLQQRLGRYKTSIEEDNAIIADPHAAPRPKVAARLLRIEKKILQGTLSAVQQMPRAGELQGREALPVLHPVRLT